MKIINFLFALLIIIVAGCGGKDSEPENNICSAGTAENCVCSDGESGSKKCESDGKGWGECVCGSDEKVCEKDQDCNDNPAVSALWGSCNEDGTCSCNDGFEINPETGKCGPSCSPSEEVCDGKDNDCDGDVDEDYVVDDDCGVGYCKTNNTPSKCENAIETACVPADALSESDLSCDGVDDNCNGEDDEDYVSDDSCGTGYCKANNVPSKCESGVETACVPSFALGENDATCDNVDDDCDGEADEDYVADDSCGNQCNAAVPSKCENGVETSCYANPVSEGTECDDENRCSHTDVCNNAGECEGVEYSCNDGKDCTVDLCKGDNTCDNAIEDNYCLIGDICYAQGALNSENPCQECVAETSSTAWSNDDANNCDDGDSCSTTHACIQGECVGSDELDVCIDDDGCCPSNCNSLNDNNCVANTHVVSEGESIQDAIDSAKAGDVIIIEPGLHKETLEIPGEKSLTFKSSNPDDPDVVASTIIDGDEEGPVFMFDGKDSGSSTNKSGMGFGGEQEIEARELMSPAGSPFLMINGLTIRNGNPTNAKSGGNGGCVNVGNALLDVDSSNIHDCGAENNGGGIYINNSHGSKISNTKVSNCFAQGNGGGIMLNNASNTLIHASKMFQNVAVQNGGGMAAYCDRENSGELWYDVSESELRLNKAGSKGGGIHDAVMGSSIKGTVITFCQAGLPFYYDSIFNKVIQNKSVVPQNQNGKGGGINFTPPKEFSDQYDPWIEVLDNEISGCQAPKGAALSVEHNSCAKPVRGIIIGNDIEGCDAYDRMGGIVNIGEGTELYDSNGDLAGYDALDYENSYADYMGKNVVISNEPELEIIGPVYIKVGETGEYVFQAIPLSQDPLYFRILLDDEVAVDWTEGQANDVSSSRFIEWDYDVVVDIGRHKLVGEMSDLENGPAKASDKVNIYIEEPKPEVEIEITGETEVEEGSVVKYNFGIPHSPIFSDFEYRVLFNDLLKQKWSETDEWEFAPDYNSQGSHFIGVEVREKDKPLILDRDMLMIEVLDKEPVKDVELNGPENINEGEKVNFNAEVKNSNDDHYYRFMLDDEIILKDWSDEGVLDWTPDFDLVDPNENPDHGEHGKTVRIDVDVSTTIDGSIEGSDSVDVVVRHKNRLPTLTVEAPEEGMQNTPIYFIAQAQDADGDLVRFKFSGSTYAGTDSVLFSEWSENEVFIWTPGENDPFEFAETGLHRITVQVTDQIDPVTQPESGCSNDDDCKYEEAENNFLSCDSDEMCLPAPGDEAVVDIEIKPYEDPIGSVEINGETSVLQQTSYQYEATVDYSGDREVKYKWQLGSVDGAVRDLTEWGTSNVFDFDIECLPKGNFELRVLTTVFEHPSAEEIHQNGILIHVADNDKPTVSLEIEGGFTTIKENTVQVFKADVQGTCLNNVGVRFYVDQPNAEGMSRDWVLAKMDADGYAVWIWMVPDDVFSGESHTVTVQVSDDYNKIADDVNGNFEYEPEVDSVVDDLLALDIAGDNELPTIEIEVAKIGRNDELFNCGQDSDCGDGKKCIEWNDEEYCAEILEDEITHYEGDLNFIEAVVYEENRIRLYSNDPTISFFENVNEWTTQRESQLVVDESREGEFVLTAEVRQPGSTGAQAKAEVTVNVKKVPEIENVTCLESYEAGARAEFSCNAKDDDDSLLYSHEITEIIYDEDAQAWVEIDESGDYYIVVTSGPEQPGQDGSSSFDWTSDCSMQRDFDQLEDGAKAYFYKCSVCIADDCEPSKVAEGVVFQVKDSTPPEKPEISLMNSENQSVDRIPIKTKAVIIASSSDACSDDEINYRFFRGDELLDCGDGETNEYGWRDSNLCEFVSNTVAARYEYRVEVSDDKEKDKRVKNSNSIEIGVTTNPPLAVLYGDTHLIIENQGTSEAEFKNPNIKAYLYNGESYQYSNYNGFCFKWYLNGIQVVPDPNDPDSKQCAREGIDGNKLECMATAIEEAGVDIDFLPLELVNEPNCAVVEVVSEDMEGFSPELYEDETAWQLVFGESDLSCERPADNPEKSLELNKYEFVTADAQGPEFNVTRQDPGDNPVPYSTPIVIHFSEEMDATSVSDDIMVCFAADEVQDEDLEVTCSFKPDNTQTLRECFNEDKTDLEISEEIMEEIICEFNEIEPEDQSCFLLFDDLKTADGDAPLTVRLPFNYDPRVTGPKVELNGSSIVVVDRLLRNVSIQNCKCIII